MRRFSLILPLATTIVAGLASVHAETSFVPRSRSSKPNMDALKSIRGGAGLLDKMGTSKAAAALVGIYGSWEVLAPKKEAQLYGVEDISPVAEYISIRSGMTMVSNVICWYFRAIKETSVDTAIGLSIIPWIVLGVHSILNEKPRELGFPLWAEVFNLVFFSVVTHANLTSADYANTATKAFAIWALLNGLLLAANPSLFGKVYRTAERDDVVLLYRRNYGFNLCSTAIFLYSLAMGVNMFKAVGYAWVPGLVGLISMMFITKDFEKLNLPLGPPVYFWLFVEALVVYTLAF